MNSTNQEPDLQHLHQLGLAKFEKHMKIMQIPKVPFSNLTWLTIYDFSKRHSRHWVLQWFKANVFFSVCVWACLPTLESMNQELDKPNVNTSRKESKNVQDINSAKKKTIVGKCDQIVDVAGSAQTLSLWLAQQSSNTAERSKAAACSVDDEFACLHANKPQLPTMRHKCISTPERHLSCNGYCTKQTFKYLSINLKVHEAAIQQPLFKALARHTTGCSLVPEYRRVLGCITGSS